MFGWSTINTALAEGNIILFKGRGQVYMLNKEKIVP